VFCCYSAAIELLSEINIKKTYIYVIGLLMKIQIYSRPKKQNKKGEAKNGKIFRK